MHEVDQLIEALRKASYKDREPLKEQLLALAKGPNGAAVREHIESAKRGEVLEVQWELEEVVEAAAPPKKEEPKQAEAPPSPPPEAPADPNKPLTAKDLTLVYDDPRGLMLHKSKVGDRWFATQFDPRTGQPQTFELHPQEIQQLKTQLAGSPYWVIGAGGVAPAGGAPAPKVTAKPGT
ncbi:MAG: hypothetical protein ACK4YP_22460, partial [Myxococcota bacterium]